MTLNSYNVEFSRNFAGFRRFGSQQQLDERRQTHTVIEGSVAH